MARQSTASQRAVRPRPVHHRDQVAAAPNLSGVPARGHRLPQAHLTRVSPLHGRAISPVSGQFPRHPQEERDPSSCFLRLSAPAFVLGHPVPPGNWPSSWSAYPTPSASDPVGVPRPHSRERPGRVPPIPRDGGALPGPDPCPASACRTPAAVPTPAEHPTAQGHYSRGITKVHAIHPSGLPSP